MNTLFDTEIETMFDCWK